MHNAPLANLTSGGPVTDRKDTCALKFLSSALFYPCTLPSVHHHYKKPNRRRTLPYPAGPNFPSDPNIYSFEQFIHVYRLEIL